jgi:hypothetical protein
MSNYLIYHVKKTSIRYVVLLLISLLSVWGKIAFTLNEDSIMGELRLIPMLIAMLEFSQFMNRRNLDTWFSMPISRVELFLIHFGNGLVHLLLSYIPAALVGYVQIADKFDSHKISRLAGSYLFSAGVFMVLAYFLFVFLFTSANNTFDGLVFMLEAFAAPVAVTRILTGIFGELPGGFDGMGIFSIIYRLTSYYMVKANDLLEMLVSENDEEPVLAAEAVLWAVICIAALAGAIWQFKVRKTEKVSGTSDSLFGYKVMIPLVTLGSLIAGQGFIISTVFALIVMAVGYIIYRRGIKLTRYDLISMGALVFVAIIVTAVNNV